MGHASVCSQVSRAITRRELLMGAGVAVASGLFRPAAARSGEAAKPAAPGDLNFPLVDYHVHLDNSTIDKVLELAPKRGVKFGIVEHAGSKENKYPVVLSNDEELARYLAMLAGKPVYRGVQAEWIDWSAGFSAKMLAQLDYILMDAMTFPGKDGKRVKLWEGNVESRVEMADKQAFMDRFVAWHVELIEQQPIDIFANLSWLPAPLAGDYEKFWTPERIGKVVDAAKRHQVALEISSSFKVPKLHFLEIAKAAGVKFSFGSNGRYPNMGQLDYSVQMAKQLGLTPSDLFTPAPDGQKAAQRRKQATSRAASAGEGRLIAPGAKLEKLAGGCKFTEGPAADAQGNVYFTDQPNDRILKWSVEGKLTTFLQPCGRSNGLCFDGKGNLWACADEQNQLWCIAPSGKATVVVKDYQGKLLNGPNDLWVRPDGGIYFTDPLYKRSYWKRGPTEQDGQCVYYLAPDHRKLVRVADDLKQPNGIIGTPDGKTLYVADIAGRKTYVYDIRPDGALAGKKLFCEMGSDGMTIDHEGNVYLTGKGVTVFDRTGKKIEQIDVPGESWTANVCFGGKDQQTLFITAGSGLYGLRMRVRGAGSQ